MKQAKRSICGLLILLIVLLGALPAFARELVVPDHEASLTLDYQYEGMPVPGARFDIYYLASVDAGSNFTLTEQFAGYPINVKDNTADSWNQLAYTLKGYAQVDKLTPEYTRDTDQDGRLTIDGLPTGLYLVVGTRVTVNEYTYTVDPTIVSVPGLDPEDDSWIYDTTVYPKSTRDKNPPDDIEHDTRLTRKVLKIWDDDGDTKSRPAKITVDLLCDGEVYDTVTLTAKDSWRHAWDNLPAYADNGEPLEWGLVERKVDGYTVMVAREGITFMVTNTPKPTPPTPPDPEKPDKPNKPNEDLPYTGLLWWPVPVLLCAGMLFLIVGVVLRRRHQ